MYRRAAAEYNVNELRELLRTRQLPLSGAKPQLIARLEECDADIWNRLDADRQRVAEIAEQNRNGDDAEQQRIAEAEAVERQRNADAERQRREADEAERQRREADDAERRELELEAQRRHIENENAERQQQEAADAERRRLEAADYDARQIAGGEAHNQLGGIRGPDQVDPELQLMRRERELLQREIELLRREQAMVRRGSSPPLSNAENTTSNARTNISIRAIGDLLSDFDGTVNTFWKWEQQIELLRVSYKLDENASRVLVSSKLKGRAANWFHSKAENLTLSIEDLLKEMRSMFDHRPSKVALRKEFEARTWKQAESFTSYYHDKVILANRVPISKDELIDYLIDGVSDTQLQNQARAMRFDKKEKLLESFRDISLLKKPSEEKKTYHAKQPMKTASKPTETSDKAAENSTSSTEHPTRCFNCQGTGRYSRDCTKPRRREKGSCFKCGASEHQLKDCPQGRQTTTATATSGAALIVQPAEFEPPYMVTVSYAVTDVSENVSKFVVSDLLDSGSPISFVKES